MNGTYAVSGVRAVLAERIVDDAVVVCEDGVIAEIRPGGPAPPHAVDGAGAFCLPGLIDTHGDALEKECNPRPGTDFPLGFALRSYESRLAGAGITTAYSGVRFNDGERGGWSLEASRAVCEALRARNVDPGVGIEHRILHRLDARSGAGLDAMLEVIDALRWG
ncbi:MAG: alpha-D-ribose 1-methylphosphonate 5-triphosphate diphosphatase, partial [Acidimicrobiia bacterium]